MSGQFWPTKHASVAWTAATSPFTGTTDTSVLLLAGQADAGTGVAARISVATAADTGTVVTALLKGLYLAELHLNVPASGDGTFGISFNASAAALLAANDPLNTLATIVAGLTATAPVSTVIPVSLTAVIPVTADNIRNSTNLIRFHGTATGAGQIQAGDLTAATVRARVTYLGDLKGI